MAVLWTCCLWVQVNGSGDNDRKWRGESYGTVDGELEVCT